MSQTKRKKAFRLTPGLITEVEQAVEAVNTEGLTPTPIHANVLIEECVRRALPDVVERYRRLARSSNGHLGRAAKTGKA